MSNSEDSQSLPDQSAQEALRDARTTLLAIANLGDGTGEPNAWQRMARSGLDRTAAVASARDTEHGDWIGRLRGVVRGANQRAQGLHVGDCTCDWYSLDEGGWAINRHNPDCSVHR